jgi:hypothetical protein
MGKKKRIAYADAHYPDGSGPEDPIRRFMGKTLGRNLQEFGGELATLNFDYTDKLKSDFDKNFDDKKVLSPYWTDIKSTPINMKGWWTKYEELVIKINYSADNAPWVFKHFKEGVIKKHWPQLEKPTTSFIDYYFDIDVPMSEEIIKKANMPIQPRYAKVTPIYNYYDADYEALADNTEFNSALLAENILFNLYLLSLKEKLDYGSILAAKKYSKKLEPSWYGKYGLPKSFNFQSIKASLQVCEIDPVCANKVKALYDWTGKGELVGKILEEFKKLPKHMRYLLFSSTDTDLLKEFEDKKYLFPMGIELEFSSQEVEAFTNTLAKAKSMFPLMYKALEAHETYLKDINKSEVVQHLSNEVSFTKTSSGKIQKSLELADATQSLSWQLSIPIDQFIKEYAIKGNAILDKALESQVTYITSGEEKIPTDKGTSFIEKLKAKILEEKLEQIIADKSLSVADLFNGAPSHTEVMFFQIDKNKGNKTIQSIIIPNSEDVSVHKYFDSQILYEKEYSYNIWVWSLVVGLEYKYSSISFESEGKFKLGVASRPNARMVRNLYFKYGSQNSPIYVLDNPPTEPNVNVVPYKNEDSKVLITVDSGIGSYITEPVELIKNEFEGIKKYQKTFLHDISDNKVLFESDDPVTSFEVFRLTERPAAYEDFAGNSLRTIKADAGGFVDQIAPNTKYYYTVRSTDVHGLVSNPSAIYEVELINNSGTIYPKIRIVNLEQSEPPQKRVKSIKRFLKIEPTGEQIAVNPLKIPANAGSAKELNKGTLANLVGILDESVFSKDKKFKIRITSKHTKKKVDVNLKFSLAETNDT